MRILVSALLLAAGIGAAAAPRDGVVVIANKQANTASLVDAARGTVLATLPVGVGPHEVAVSHNGRWAVVTNYGDRQTVGTTLSVIDLRRRRVTRTLSLGRYRRPHGIAFLPGDRELVVTSETDSAVVVVDFAAGSVAAAIPTGQAGSHMLAVSRDGKRAYTANIGNGSVTEIDLANRRQGRILPVAPRTEGIALSPDGRQLWVGSNEAHTVSIVDTDRWEVVGTIPAAGLPYRVAFTPDGRHALVPAPMAGVIRIFDTATRTERAAIAAPAGPVGVTPSANSAYAFVSLQEIGKVAVVDLARGAVTDTLPAGAGPDGIAFAPR
jgi:YVTN family beta-propeller protein